MKTFEARLWYLFALIIVGGVACASAAALEQADVRLTVDTDHPTHDIHPYVYGHFFEHIYHSANGGLWGELVWNRSFELSNAGAGEWSVEGEEVVQSGLATDVHMAFGDLAWGDYELTLQARQDGGAEGFLILVRAADEENFYWLNLGGWGNTRHAVEKEVEGRRGTIGRGRDGRVETGRWHDIRVRCEGERIQCWLDDDMILDVEDQDGPHRTGSIGLGTWGTQARYRAVRVTSLDGAQELFAGLPTLPKRVLSIDFWEHFGSGGARRVPDSLNNDYGVSLTGDGTPTGIEQADYRIQRQGYHGSLWMKGSLPAGIRVALMDGDHVLGEARLDPPSAVWAEYPFRIEAKGDTDDGSFRITLLGEGSVTLDHVSLMGDDAKATGGFRPDLLEAIRGLRPPIIRWPGGCFASVYLWKDAVGPQHERRIYPAYMWEDQDINSFGTDEFMRLCKAAGAEPMVVINTGILQAGCGAPAQFRLDSKADYLPYALAWMEYCNGDTSTPMGALRATHGHPEPYNVLYWELDNETWAAGVDAYNATVLDFAPAMRAKAEELGTSIKLIACGGSRFDMEWNRALIDACAPLIDYVSIHNYENPDNFGSGVDRYENLLVELAGYIADSANPNLEIYNSEWNAQSTDWRTGLYAGGLLNAYERQGEKFTLGGPALFLRHQSAGGWDNAFINFDHTGWFPAPNYVVMQLWWDHFEPKFLPVAGDADGCNIVATRDENGRRVVIKAVNPGAVAKTIEIALSGGLTPVRASMQQVAPGSLRARNTLAEPNAVRPHPGQVALDGRRVRFELPAQSVAVVRVD